MAAFVKVTQKGSGAVIWVNFDQVLSMTEGQGETEIAVSDGHEIIVNEQAGDIARRANQGGDS